MDAAVLVQVNHLVISLAFYPQSGGVVIGEKLGRPLIETVGKPRVHPQSLPAPEPVPEPEEKEKEKVPTTSQHHIAEMAYNDLETAIQKSSTFLGISESQVVNMLLDIAQHIVTVMKLGSSRLASPRTDPQRAARTNDGGSSPPAPSS